MVYYLIMCRSLTYAQRTARVLERAGIGARVMRAPSSVSPEGCNYCVRIGEKYLPECLTVLKGEGLPPKRIYVHDGSGDLREVGA